MPLVIATSETLGYPSAKGLEARLCDPIIIVGNGPSGIQALVELRRLGVHWPITLFGKEGWGPYDRVKLSSFLAGTTSLDALLNLPDEVADNVTQYVGRAISAIDTVRRLVTDDTGALHPYSKLILALGSRAYVPGITGRDKAGVFRFRDLADAQALMARTVRSRHTVIVGGGLLGIEAARAMHRMSTRVTLIQHSDRLMNRQLDAEGAAMVRDALEGEGVCVRLNTQLREIVGDQRVEGVWLANGELLVCDSVVFATGIVPNHELAEAAGLKVAAGIRVDEFMRTSCADVYAVGECAQFGERISGLVAPGLRQARAAAAHICGKPEPYAPTADTTWLKVLSLDVFSAGEFTDEHRFRIHQSLVYRDAAKAVYRRIMLRRGRVVGVVAIGEWPERQYVVALLRDKKRVLPWQAWRFRLTGSLGPSRASEDVAAWPSTALICQCKGLTRGDLGHWLPQCGSEVARLKALSGAATVCGGCEPLLKNLCGQAGPASREVPGAIGMSNVALLTLVALFGLWLAPVPEAAANLDPRPLLETWSRNAMLRQLSGYLLLVLSLIAMLLSFRKRLNSFRVARFSSWRIVHAMVGFLAVALLTWHTGFQLGENLNQWLMVAFLTVIASGVVSALLLPAEAKIRSQWPGRLRRGTNWLHILVLWPVPVLLGFHILSAYYF